MKPEAITKGAVLKGIDASDVPATVLAIDPVDDDEITVYYKTNEGSLSERMLFRTDEDSIQSVKAGLPWSFDGDADSFKIAAEAYRVHLAYLFDPSDVSKENLGWDVQARAVNGEVRFIEVKAQAKCATTVTVTKNEILASLNQPDRYYLAIVIVDGDEVDGPHYIQRPFDQEFGFGVIRVNIDLPTFLGVAEEQAAYGKAKP